MAEAILRPEGGGVPGEPVVECKRRAAEDALDRVGDRREASFADGAPEGDVSGDFFGLKEPQGKASARLYAGGSSHKARSGRGTAPGR